MRRKTTRWILLILAVGAIAAPVAAQVSAHYDLVWHLLSGGGGARVSSHYHIDDVTGQWVDGPSSSSNYRIDPGYWPAGGGSTHRLYLPLIFASGADLESREIDCAE